MNEFGDCSSDVTQIIKIITYLELEIIDPEIVDNMGDEKRTFILEIFPSEVPQFLVPSQIYEHKKACFDKLNQMNKIIGQRFRTYRGNQLFQGREVKVEEISPIEQDGFKESAWESILVSEVKPISDSRFDRGRRNTNRQNGNKNSFDRNECVRINFWDLVMSMPSEDIIQSSNGSSQSQSMKAVAKERLPQAFDEMETERLKDAIRLFVQKNQEM